MLALLAISQAVPMTPSPFEAWFSFVCFVSGSIAIGIAKVYLGKQFGGIYTRLGDLEIKVVALTTSLNGIPKTVPSLDTRLTRLETEHQARHVDRRADFEEMRDRDEDRERRAQGSLISRAPGG